MIEINVHELLEKASKYTLCQNFQPVASILNVRKVFSFTLFLARPPTGIQSGVVGDPKPQTIRAWVQKYFLTQRNKFIQLLNDPHWSDFGIIWFLDAKLLRSKMKFDNKNTIKTIIDNIIKDYPGRIAVLGYDCSNVSDSVWYGSIVRFAPLAIGELDVVIFRDAHSTIPNPHNRYDRNWYETWYNLKGDEFKKYWLYQMITYNPIHAGGEKVPFAATWGARATHENGSPLPIMKPKLWNKYFGDPSRDPGVYYPDFDTGKEIERIAPEEYGIDERIFSQMIYETDFLSNSYIIGITWFLFLFNPETNPRQFKRYVDNSEIIYCALHTGMHSIALHTYPSEARCVIYYIAETFGDGWDTTLIDLFKIIGNLQARRPADKRDRLIYNLVGMLPSFEHLWEFLFDTSIVNPYSGITLSETIQKFGMSHLNYKNMCNVIGSYFRGGEINYDRYIHDPEYKDISPPQYNIKVPSGYPYKKIAGGTSKFLGLF